MKEVEILSYMKINSFLILVQYWLLQLQKVHYIHFEDSCVTEVSERNDLEKNIFTQ